MRYQLLAASLAAFPIVCDAASQFTTLEPVGVIAVAPGAYNIGAEYFYQIRDGSIVRDIVSGPFNSASTTDVSHANSLPPSPALYGTPIAVIGTDSYVRIQYAQCGS